jgi:hypothetical protein
VIVTSLNLSEGGMFGHSFCFEDDFGFHGSKDNKRVRIGKGENEGKSGKKGSENDLRKWIEGLAGDVIFLVVEFENTK